MSQANVYEFLKENKGKKYTSREISKHLGIGMTSVSVNCRRLFKRKEISIVDIVIKNDRRNRAIPHYFIKEHEKIKDYFEVKEK